MTEFTAELIGTFLLVYLGNGVVANVLLTDTKGNGGGWVVITIAWGLAVFVGVAVAGPFSGAHLNPAVTIGLAAAGKFEWGKAVIFIAAQMLGAMLGALFVWLHYKSHYDRTEDEGLKFATFATAPAIKNIPENIFSEVTGTFVLVFTVLYLAGPSVELSTGVQLFDEMRELFSDESQQSVKIGLGSIGALPVALLVIAIGMSLGGTTGYAINPARDLGPRIVHTLLPFKAGSDWGYGWVPVAGPVLGALLAAGLYLWVAA